MPKTGVGDEIEYTDIIVGKGEKDHRFANEEKEQRIFIRIMLRLERIETTRRIYIRGLFYLILYSNLFFLRSFYILKTIQTLNLRKNYEIIL